MPTAASPAAQFRCTVGGRSHTLDFSAQCYVRRPHLCPKLNSSRGCPAGPRPCSSRQACRAAGVTSNPSSLPGPLNVFDSEDSEDPSDVLTNGGLVNLRSQLPVTGRVQSKLCSSQAASPAPSSLTGHAVPSPCDLAYPRPLPEVPCPCQLSGQTALLPG